MNNKTKKYLLVILVIIFLLSSVFLVKNIFKKNNNKFNISNLSDEFVEEYLKNISESSSDEEKKNMIIVISDNKIKDSYGAKNIIESPNHQYILQYNSEKEKESALKKLKNDKRIDSVEENNIYKTEEENNTYKTEDGNYNSWGIEKMSLDYAINSANTRIESMQQVTVAIVDTGCDMALFNKYYDGRNLEIYNILEHSTTTMIDEYGHGTHIAGTIAEGTPDNVKILPIKVSRTGSIYTTDIIAAINYIVHYNKAQVINMSFGSYMYSEAMYEAIKSAQENNIISVAAAGNENTSAKHYPSSFDNTLSIASVDSNLNKSTFSNYGSEVNFTAPGTNIKSIMGKDAIISRENGNNCDDDHEIISGTSMATPHVASAVAVLKSYNKNLTFDNVVDILKENTVDLGEKGWDKYYGNGLISFNDVQFCDGISCDKLGIYKVGDESISSIKLTNLIFTQYNYYSVTNLMGSKIKVNYTNNTSEELTIGELPNVEILNYDPTISESQTITIKLGTFTTDIQVTNPSNYKSGWEYNVLENGKVEITGYKNHNLKIEKLYIPETIDSKQVVSFADDFKFAESGNDIKSYTYLYLPSTFTRVGNYSLSETDIKYIYGSNNKIEVGSHAFENSKIVSIDIPIVKIDAYAFNGCLELRTINIFEEQYTSLTIGKYAFYNCKKLASVKMIGDATSIGDIGDYAFYNCVSLSFTNLVPISKIGEYAFYNTSLLSELELYNSHSIGQFAFYGSGITKVEFSRDLNVINKSSFENCKNLKKISYGTNGSTRIESRAFYNSGIEEIGLTDDIEYIAEDAFAYAPIKNSTFDTTGTSYQVVSNLGIVKNDNKLLVGFTSMSGSNYNGIGATNTEIPENITEIGNYAFTGNNNLKKIIIPANVTKIGTHAFEDCYQLSDVYMLGSTIEFEDSTFKRNYEGEIKNADLKIYMYKDSQIKQFVKDKNLDYRHIDPDEVIVKNYKSKYKALSQVDTQTLEVKLIYHEEEDREEVLTEMKNGIGFAVGYQTVNAYDFQYGDTYFVVKSRNTIGYLLTKNIDVDVEKVIPTYTIPTGLTAYFGQQLSEIELPSGFEWMDGSQIVTGSGKTVYKAKYVPTDTKNYKTIENIDVTVTVDNSKTIIVPEIIVGNMTYDGTTDIPISNIDVSNLKSSDYSIVSAVSSSSDAGERKAKIKLRLSNEKFENYAFSNGQQEKEFTVNFEILKANINVVDNSKDVTVKYDGDSHSVVIDLKCNQNITIEYMNSNDEYTLTRVPTYTKVGTYIIKYRVYVNDNYTEYFGQKKLIIEDDISYVINNYEVDETNKYINKIMINTGANNFISNITLGDGYEVEVDTKNINNKQLLYTGGKTKITKGSTPYREYMNVVIGDINGDAAINSADLLKIRQHLLGTNILNGAYFLSSDINYDNTINSADLLRVRQHLLGTKPIE